MRENPAETDGGAGPDAPALQRTIGPTQMALYGLGSMLGAGIYGLIGKAAGQAGNAVWLSFVVALGFIRLATHPAVWARPVPTTEAIAAEAIDERSPQGL